MENKNYSVMFKKINYDSKEGYFFLKPYKIEETDNIDFKYEILVSKITGENTFIKSNHNRAVNWVDGTAEKTGLAIYAGKLKSVETNDEYMNLLTSKYLATGKVATLLADGTIEINDAPASAPESE